MTGGERVTVDADAIPEELKERAQWLMWDASADAPRRPHWRGDFSVSWTDPDDWHTFDEAIEAASEEPSWGIGYVFAYGNSDFARGMYGAIDLDGCLTDEGRPKDWLPSLEPFIDAGAYIERSPSGTGLHIPIVGFEPPEWWRDVHLTESEHEGVEAYSKKFFTFTGDALDVAGNTVVEAVDVDSWLLEAYESITGELPQTGAARGEYDGDTDTEDLDVRAVIGRQYKPGERFSHPVHGSGTGSNFMVDEGGETFRCWRHSVTGNAYHLAGVEAGIIDCGEWDRGGLRKQQWREIFDYCRKQGYIEKRPRSDRESGETDGSDESDEEGTDDDTATWEEVRALFESDANGTTTKGYARAVDILDEEYTIVTVRDSEAIYFYDTEQGYYHRKGQTFIREEIEKHLGDAANENRKREILNKWRDKNFVSVDEFTPEKGKVNLKDGVLDLERWEDDPARENAIEEHSPDHYFTSQLNVSYNPDAEGGLWVDQLERAIGNTDEIEKLEQFIGYCLEAWHHDREKNMFFVGQSRTGKSSIQEAIQALFGEAPTVTALTPQQLADTQFDAAALFEAALNTVNDINASKIQDSGTLKRIWSGEKTKMVNKYEDRFFAAPNAKHLYTANWLPRIVGTDEAIWRRILIIEFTNQLTEAEKDRSVKRRLKEDHEVRQVILNRALEARRKLNDQDRFTADRSMKDTRELWDSWRSNNKRFLYTHFTVTADPSDSVEKKTYWQAYNEWCAKHGYEPAGNRSVSKELGYVAGIGTSDDHHYTGLKWDNEHGSDDDHGEQGRLALSQQARRNQVQSIISTLDSNNGAVPVEQVKGYAAAEGFDTAEVENDIEHWLTNGELTDAGGGKIYPT